MRKPEIWRDYMSLTDEKKRLKEAAIKLSPLYGTFEKIDEADSSYYK